MDLREASLFVTGGAGTLGRAIAARRRAEGWKGKFTVYSRHTHILEQMKRDFPEVGIVQGDIRDSVTLYNAMVGHDVCLHLAAVKVIPVSEFQSIDTYKVNVEGSLNVCQMAVRAGLQSVLGISTDKACKSVNAYGSTKYLMEKIFQEYSRMDFKTEFHLVRYGNVLESNGSVIEAWKRSILKGEAIKMTDPAMTRFWISPQQAVNYVLRSMNLASGHIYIPRMPGLSIGKLAKYCLADGYDYTYAIETIPVRPGEKMHECLLTDEEGWYALPCPGYFDLSPTTCPRKPMHIEAYTSDIAPELTREELAELLLE